MAVFTLGLITLILLVSLTVMAVSLWIFSDLWFPVLTTFFATCIIWYTNLIQSLNTQIMYPFYEAIQNNNWTFYNSSAVVIVLAIIWMIFVMSINVVTSYVNQQRIGIWK